MQYSEQKNNILTPGNGLPYFSAKQDGRRKDGLLQRIHVRTSQKCPKCKGKFKDVVNELICPICHTVATRMYLEWWFDNIRYYLNGFKSYIDAQRKAVSIEADINNYSFKPEKYKVNVYAAKNQFPLFLKIPAITEGHYYSENLKRFLVVLLSVHSGFQ